MEELITSMSYQIERSQKDSEQTDNIEYCDLHWFKSQISNFVKEDHVKY